MLKTAPWGEGSTASLPETRLAGVWPALEHSFYVINGLLRCVGVPYVVTPPMSGPGIVIF
jgi:hypothetical protein